MYRDIIFKSFDYLIFRSHWCLVRVCPEVDVVLGGLSKGKGQREKLVVASEDAQMRVQSVSLGGKKNYPNRGNPDISLINYLLPIWF